MRLRLLWLAIFVFALAAVDGKKTAKKKKKNQRKNDAPKDSGEDASNVNKAVKLKRDAKSKARKKFLDKHGIVFDSYGR
eukprot:g4045.t1